MKRILLTAAIMAGYSAMSASAITYQDIDFVNEEMSGGIFTPDIFIGFLDLNPSDATENDSYDLSAYGEGIYEDAFGYGGAPPVVTSAEVAFYFKDDGDRQPELVSMLFPILAGSYDFDLAVLSDSLSGLALLDLHHDGTVNYEVNAHGDFTFEYARLTVEVGSVPDGGLTIGLLSMSMLGLMKLRRRISS